jgi:hypothetical protein
MSPTHLTAPLFALVLSSAALGCGTSGTAAAGAPLAGASALSTVEAADLTFLREEEKLARDVYLGLAVQGQPFVNIASAEQRHMDATLTLLERYGLDDPAAGNAEGVFTDPALQKLHETLRAAAAASPAAALAVGAEIEEIDLGDLTRAGAESSHEDVRFVYDNLARGSRNHLRAFYGSLRAVGVDYTPRHLSAAAFTAIVSSGPERGPGGGRGQHACGAPHADCPQRGSNPGG